MGLLTGKKVVLGMTGGIAAYKCPELVRRLKEHGCEVKVVMTEGAKAFITPLTLQAVSGNLVSDSLLDPQAEAAMGHIEFAKWADLIVVAPASADAIARIRAGMANDLLTTLILATDAQVAIAPAMNQQMYKHPATQENLTMLTQRGTLIWGPAQGQQACGDVGPGRMEEPATLVNNIINCLSPTSTNNSPDYSGLTVTITAGPTREALDPVRYLSNHSSGKMGFAIAQAAAEAGANVNLIAGPVALNTPDKVNRINVVSAEDMYKAAMTQAVSSHIFIACAAVADYAPIAVNDQKMKKSADDGLTITLKQNPDIVASVAALTKDRPFTVGFAAETQHVEQYARNKLAKKNLDMICANDVSVSGQGFNSDNNALTIYWQDGSQQLPLADKKSLAKQLLNTILPGYQKQL